MNSATLVQKLWNYCNVLRDDGMSYGDYPRFRGDRLPQLTYLLFLKMADERSRPPYHQPSPIPAAYAWPALRLLDGDALFDHYRHTLEELGRQPGTLALIFGKAQKKVREAKLPPRSARQPVEAEAGVKERLRRHLTLLAFTH